MSFRFSMHKLLGFTIYAALALACCSSAAATEDVPSLCEGEEEIILTATVSKVIKGETVEDAPPKIVSVCGTSKSKQIDQLIYRFGSEKNAEIEIRATPGNGAKIFEESDAAAHAGRLGIRFEKPPYSYEVSEGAGMSSVVSVEVYKNKTHLALYQGSTSLGCPYASDLASISSSSQKVAPGILVKSKPIKPW